MTGIVIVSHSAELAEGLRKLAEQMGQGKVPLAAAGGIDDPDEPIGTDAMKILEAIQQVYSDDGVIVFMDMGSAILSTEMALDFLEEEQRTKVVLSAAPLAEGVITAAVTAAAGGSLQEILSELTSALTAKQSQLGVTASADLIATSSPPKPASPADTTPTTPTALVSSNAGGESPPDTQVNTHSGIFVLENTLGIHARPAARIATISGKYEADIQLRNLTLESDFVSARSINALIGLQAIREHTVELRATGSQADKAYAELADLLRRHFDESTDAPGKAANSPKETPNPHSFNGITVGKGVAIGPAFLYANSLPEIKPERADNPDDEKQRLRVALDQAVEELDDIASRDLSASDAEIFQAHKLIVTDPELLKEVHRSIEKDQSTAGYAWWKTIQQYMELYRASSSPVLAERAADVQDAGGRVLRHLTGEQGSAPQPDEPSILVTEELSPSIAASLDTTMIIGILTAHGSATSHSGILVSSLGIPAVFGVSSAIEKCQNGQQIILDGDNARVYLKPTAHQLEQMKRRRENWLKTRSMADGIKLEAVYAPDGSRLEVLSNVSAPEHVKTAIQSGAEGIGLYRTEFLFMGRSAAPDENEQYETYRQAVEAMDGKPVTFRTIDIGGDKPVDYLSIEKEANPFLGWRGIRFSLDRPEVFRTQIRALLRASAHGPVKIMFPMVATLAEWQQARKLTMQASAELRSEGIDHQENTPLGIMIEIPAAALSIGEFLPEVDFVSIGTNDLTQYVMAADRMNGKVAALASYRQPAVLKLIETSIRSAQQHNVPVSMCGEMARDTAVTRLLLDYGLRSFSMNAGAVPEFKLFVRNLSADEPSEASSH